MNPRHTTPPPSRSFLRAWLVLGFVLGFSALVLRAPPTDGTVVHGNATIATAPNLTTVTADHNSVLRWGSFDIASGETVRFVQPGSDARVMNWIGGLAPSQINGSLLANGQVYLLNPNGVFFGQTAVVDAARLYAVGGSLAKEDFLAGLDRFTGLTGSVNNAGTIRGDLVALVGRSVANTGTIVSPGGFIGLAAGGEVLLGQDGSSIFVNTGAAPTPASSDAPGVSNSGTVDAGAGTAVLAAGDFYSIAITHDGKLAGREVKIQGQGTGEVHVRGTIDVSARVAGVADPGSATATGGRIEVTGEKVGLFDDARLDASGPAGGGTILVGGDFQGKNPDIRNAFRTYVAPTATLTADATTRGNGGKIIIWADDITRFFGTITARGGPVGGDGGFVETSGKINLAFNGVVRTDAVAGQMGTLLLDPTDLTISNTLATTGTLDVQVTATTPGIIAFGDGAGSETVSAGALEALAAATNIDLQATNSITIQSLTTLGKGGTNGELTLDQTGSVKFRTGAGGFSMDPTNTINITGTGTLLIDAIAATSGGTGNGSITTGSIQTNGGSVTLNGTSMTLGAINSGAGLITINNSGAATQTGVFAGSGGLTKTGGGTLTLSQANTYTGTTTIDNGPVAYAANDVIASGAVVVTGGFANLNLGTFNDTVGTVTLTSDGFITGTTGVLTTTGSFEMQAGTVTAILAGTGTALNKTTGGTVHLNSASTYTGVTTVSGGLMNVSSLANIGTASSIGAGDPTNAATNAASLVLNGGTMRYTGAAQSTDRLFTLTDSGGTIDASGSGALSFTNVGSVAFSGTAARSLILTGTNTGTNTFASILGDNTGATSLTKSGAGAWTLSGTNTYTGVTTINGGTLSVASIGNGGVAGNLGQAAAVAGNLVLGGGTLQYTGANDSTDRNFTLTSATTSTIDVTTNNLTMTGASAATDGGLTKSGAGTLTLSGSNAHTGLTTISAGTLAYGASDVLSTGAVTVNGTGVLALGNNQSDTLGTVTVAGSGSVTGTGTSSLTTTGTFEMQSGSVSAILAGAVPLNKTTVGTVTLSGANTYTGVTTINGGILSVATIGNGGVAGNLGQATNAAGNLVLGGGTLQYTGATASTDRNFTLTSATTSTIDVTTNNLTMSGASAATDGALTKSGAGILTLSGSNAHTGLTTVSAGTLAYGASDVLSTGAVTVNGGTAVLSLGANNDSVGTVTVAGGGSITGSGTLTSTGTFEMQDGSVGAVLAGAVALNKTTTGSVTLSGTNTYTGATTVGDGTLIAAANGAFGTTAGNTTVSSGATVGFSGGINYSTAEEIVLNGTGETGRAGALDNISGNNTFDGSLTLVGGGSSTIGTTAGNFTHSGTSVGASDFTYAPAAGTTITESGVISGIGTNVIKNGAGTLVLSGINTYTGSTTLNTGSLRATTNAEALGAGTLTLAGGTLELANDTGLNFGRNTTVTGNVQVTSDRLTSGAGVTHTLGTLSIGAQTLTVAAGSNVSSGTAGLTFGATSLTGGATFSPGASSLLTLGAVTGAGNTLTVGGTGAITFSSTVGGSGTALGAVTINNGVGAVNLDGDLFAASVSAPGAASFDSTGAAINTTGAANADGGAVAITTSGALTVGAITTDGGTAATDSVGRAAGSVTLNSGGTLTTGTISALGSAAESTDTTTRAGGAGGTVALTGTTQISLGGNINASGGAGAGTPAGATGAAGSVTLNSPVALTTDVGITASTVTLNSTVAGSTNDLAVTGNAVIGGAVTNVADLSVSGTTAINASTVTTTGTQTYTGAVTVGAQTTLSTTNSDVTFGNTIDADDAVTNDRTLTVNAGGGTVSFGGNIGNNQPLADLDITAASIVIAGAMIKIDDDYEDGGTNTVTFNGAVRIAENIDLTVDTNGTTDNSVTFSGATNGTAGGGDETLTLNAGTGTLNLAAVSGAGGVADATGLTAVTVTDAGTTNFNGAIAITGALTQTNAATGATTFGNTVAVGSATLRGTTFDVQNSLTSTGAIAVTNSGLFTKGATGAITAPGGFSTSGAASLANNITTTNTTLSIGGALTLAENADVVLSTQGAAGAGDITLSGATNGTAGGGDETLTLNAGTGTIDLNGAVGGSAALGAFTVTSGGQADLQAITATGGAISVTASTINVDGVLTTTGGAGGALSITGGGITINATPSVGATNITLTGNGNDVVINSALTDDASITVTAPRDVIVTATVQATGATSDLVITGDTDANGVGGVLVRQAGQVDAGRHATLTGSALNSTLDSAAGQSVFVVADGANTQVLAAGNVSLTSGASAPVGADIQISGLVSSSGAGTITVNAADQIGLAANVSTAGGDITFSDAVVLGTDVQISTGAAGGNILFSSTVNGTAGATAETLTVLAGTGNVTFTGNVGNNTNSTELEALTITSAATALFSGNIELANALTQSAGSVATTFSGTVNVGSAALTGTAFNLNNSFASGGTTSFTNSGTLTKNATGAITSTGAFSTSGNVNLANNITTTNTSLSIGGNLKVADGTSVTLSTQGAAGAGDITISGNTDGTTGGAGESLTLNAGTGSVTFTGSIHGFGGGLDSSGLNNVTITDSGAASFNSTIAIFGALTQTNAATGTTTFGNTVSVGSATLRGTSYAINNSFASDGTTSFTNSGTITKNATGNITSTGAFSTTGDVNLAANITTTDTNLTIGGNLVVAENADVTLSTGAGGAGAITVTGTTNGTAGGGDESLTVLAGTGNVTFTGNVGTSTNSTELEALTITSAATTLFSGNIELANALTQSAGSVATTFTGTVNVGSAALSGTAFNLNNGFTSAGTTSFTNSGTLTKNSTGSITSTGAFSTSGDVNLAANITTSDADLTIGGNLVVAEAATPTLSTGAGGAGAITVTGTTNGTTGGAAEALTVLAGTGNVTFTGNVGNNTNSTELEALTITSAATTLFSGNIELANALTQSAGSVATTFNGTVNVGSAALTGTAFNLNGALSTSGGGTLTFTNSGLLTINANVTSDGAVTQNGTGAVAITGSRTISTTSDAVDFLRAVTLNGAGSTVAINTTASGAGANITFQGTLDGTTAGATAEDLTLTAGTAGSVTFTGAVGGGTRLGDLTIASANNVVETAGLTAATFTQSSGAGTTTLNGAVNTNAAGGINLTGTNLAVNAGITTTGGGPVTVNQSGTAAFAATGDITADGAVSLTAAGGISTAGDITTTNDNVTYVSAVTLTGAVQITAGSGNVTFSSIVNGGQALTANSSGTTTFAAAVGGATALASLTTDAGGTTAINGGTVSTTGAQTYNDAVTLGANTTLTVSTATFNGTLAGGGSSLTVTGNAVFGDATGDTVTGLSTLGVSGVTAINTNTVTTTGTQAYSGAVILGVDTTLTTTNSTVSFASTINSSSFTARDLTVDAGTGAITVSGAVGGTNVLDVLTLNSSGTTTLGGAVATGSLITNAGGTTAINGGSVTTTGTQTYNDAVTLNAAANATTLTGTDITFASTVRSTTDGEEALTVTGSGTTTYVGAVGDNSQRLASLTTNGGGTTVLNGGSVMTTGAQTYTDAVALGADTTLATTNSTVSLASTLDSSSATARDLTVSAGSGAITIGGATGGTNALDVVALNSTGTTTLGGTFTAATLTTNTGGSTAINGGAVTTTGGQTYNDAVTLGADTTLTTTNSSVSFASTLNSANATARDLTVNAGSGSITATGVIGGVNLLDAVALNSTGTTTLTSAVSAGSVATDAGGTTAINGGTVTTSGAQTYNDAVTLGANTTLTAATTTFNGTLAGGANSLTVAGNAVFGDATGDTVTGLSTLGISGTTTINTSTVTTTGTQTYGGAVILGADTTLATTNSAVGFASTINSANATARDLTVSTGSGSITASGTVGGTFALDALTLNSASTTTLGSAVTAGSLTTNAGGTTAINGGAVTTTGDQIYNDPVTINATGNATTLTGANVAFASTVRSATDGEDALTVTGSGTTTFVGAVGDNSQRLAALTSDGGGATIVNGASVTTTGAQTFGDAVVLEATGNLTTFTASDVAFGSTLRSQTDGEEALVVNSTGTTSFGGAVGDNSQRLATLTSNTTGLTAINSNVTTVGAQTYYDDVRIDGDAILTATNSAVLFTDDIDSQASEANDLTVNTGTGAITVSGLIGTAPNGAMGTVTFNNSYTGGFVIPTTNAAALSVTTNGPVTDTGSLAISGQATVNAGTNAVTLGDAAGETTNFGSLAVTGGTVIVTEDSGTNLTGLTASTLTLTSAGPITDSPGTTISVAGQATFDSGANSITLGDDPFAPGTLDTTNFGTLTIASAGAVTITEDSFMDLTATTTGDITVRGVGMNISGVTAPAITVYSTGPITDSGPLLISGLALFDAGTFDVTLDDNGNNFSTVQLFGATITITDADLFTLQGLLSSGPFTALSVGDMTVTAALNASFDLSLTAQNGSLLISAPVGSGGNLTLTAGQRFESSSTLSAGGEIQIEAGTSALFTGNLQINGPFTVEAASVQFDGTLNGSGTAGDLLVLTPGDTRFNGAIGNSSPIHNLTTDAGGTTHLAGGTVAVAGTLEFRDAVVVDANATITAAALNVHESFVGGTDGGQSLTLNVSGDTVFDNVVGAAGSRFASVNTDAIGRTLFYGGSLRTTGDQVFRDRVLLGRSMIFAGNNVTFANTVNTGNPTSPLTDGSILAAAGDSDLTVVAAGRTLFEAAVGQESAGRLGRVVIGDAASTLDTTELQANFNATSLEINNPVTFNGVGSPFTVDTTSTQVYANAATLVTDMTFNSAEPSAVQGITFQGEISGAGRNLTMTAPTGAITMVGSIGAEDARFTEVRVSGRNLVVGGDIWTTGDIRLAMGEGAAADTNDYLAFNVFGTDVPAKSTRLDSETGEIILGTGATSADPEAAGKTDVPLRATIFKSNDGDLYLMARKITVQPNERLAVRDGSLIAIADGEEAGDGITLSSTAASDLLVLATSVTGSEPSIFIRSRGKANMIAPDGTTTIEDQGTEIIAGAVLFYNAAFASTSAPMPTRTAFSPAAEGDNLFTYDTALAPGNLLTKVGGVVFEVLPASGGTTELVYVADLLVTNRQYRPTVGNLTYLTMTTVSTAFGGLANQYITPDLFGTIPSAGFAQTVVVSENAAPQQTAQTVFIPTGAPVESASAPPEADLAAAVREQLQALGIYARALTPEEKEARDRLAATFVTVPGRERPAESDYEVADARVEDRAVREVLRVANEIGLIGEGQAALSDVAQALQSTYDKYRASSAQADLDAKTLVTEYRAWLESDQGPESAKVLAYLKSLGATIRKIELLGLTAQELEVSKAQIYGSVLRDRLNVDPEFLSELVKRVSEEVPVAAKEEKKTQEPPKAPPILQAAVPARSGDASAVN